MREYLKKLSDRFRRFPILFSLIKAVTTPSERLYRHLYFFGPFDVRLEDTRFKIMHYGYVFENELFWNGYGRGSEGLELRVWAALCAEADYIIDVGANTGVYALAASSIRPGAHVLALEPAHRVNERLLANIALNGFDIDAPCVAASDHDGRATMHDPAGVHAYSASLESNMAKRFRTEAIEIETRRIDTLTAALKWPRVDLVKIDVEMHEPAVLEGMKITLAYSSPSMIIEVLEPSIGERIINLLNEFDYMYFNLDQENGLVPTRALGSHEHRNYLACAKSELPTVARKLGSAFSSNEIAALARHATRV